MIKFKMMFWRTVCLHYYRSLDVDYLKKVMESKERLFLSKRV